MKASIYTNYGSPDQLNIEEINQPIPKDDELLIRVHASTVNRTDCAMLRAKPFIMRFFTGFLKPSNPILGTDFSGVIEFVGKNVSKFQVGEAIFGFNDAGISSHAEYLCLKEDSFIAIIPSGITFAQAAASIEGMHYAQNFINKVQIKPTASVFVNGATGAIGSAMVQLLTALNIKVTATTNTKNIALIKSLGVHRVVDYEQVDFTDTDERYDFVFDAVGKSTFGKCKKILKPNGIYISSELGPNSQNLFYALFTPLFGGKKVVFPYPHKHQISVDLVKKLISDGKFYPLIDKTYPLDEIANAFRFAETGNKTGNLILNIYQANDKV